MGGTLAPCEGVSGVCLSTFDDRPAHFAPPWEFDGALLRFALRRFVFLFLAFSRRRRRRLCGEHKSFLRAWQRARARGCR
jgi:hypothetical protein